MRNVVREQYQELIEAKREYERQPFVTMEIPDRWPWDDSVLTLTVTDYAWLRSVGVRV